MAPEVLKGKTSYSEAIDMWSFGIFAFELAQGDPPFVNLQDEQKVHFHILTHEMPEIDARWSDNFRDFVGQCLTKDATQRATAAELLQHEWLEDAGNSKTAFKEFIK